MNVRAASRYVLVKMQLCEKDACKIQDYPIEGRGVDKSHAPHTPEMWKQSALEHLPTPAVVAVLIRLPLSFLVYSYHEVNKIVVMSWQIDTNESEMTSILT